MSFRRKRTSGLEWILGAVLVVAVLALAACSSDAGPKMARVQILVTDLPSDYISSAVFTVSRVYLQGGTEGEEEGDGSGRHDLFNDPDNPQVFDLIALQGGLMFELTPEVLVPEGTYSQLRFVVEQAEVTYSLDDGQTSTTLTLQVPSGHSSGVKVNLSGPLQLNEELTKVLVDVPVDDNFVIQGNPGTSGVNGILFTPSLQQIPPPA